MEAFQFSTLMDAFNIMRLMLIHEVELIDFMRWFDHRVKTQKAQIAEAQKSKIELVRDLRYFARRCPDCGGMLSMMPVNTMPCDQVGSGYQSAWYCPAVMACGFIEFSELRPQESLKAFSPIYAELVEEYRSGRRTNPVVSRRHADAGCGGCNK